jgi:hypothetical protein
VNRLTLYWYELTPGHEHRASWGQLVGSVHRLHEVREELRRATRLRDVRAQLRRLTLTIEAYLYRAFELRERSIRLLVLMTGKAAEQVRHPNQRAQVFSRLLPTAPVLVKRIKRLFNLLDSDVLLRNMHTHEQFLCLGIYTGNNVYDPDDALNDVEHDSKAFDSLAQIPKTESRHIAKEYSLKIRRIANAALRVAEAADPRRATSP